MSILQTTKDLKLDEHLSVHSHIFIKYMVQMVQAMRTELVTNSLSPSRDFHLPYLQNYSTHIKDFSHAIRFYDFLPPLFVIEQMNVP